MPEVSVIIPTYNRLPFLLQALQALASQSFPSNRFEVIIVDDGSHDKTSQICKVEFPFQHHYIWQENSGDASARNKGVCNSNGTLLVFLDDDVLVGSEYISSLVQAHLAGNRQIIIGTENLWLNEDSLPELNMPTAQKDTIHEITFADICSNNMSIHREHYYELGMMRGLDFPGSSIWCDIDFSYRAREVGFTFMRSENAQCWHRDYTKNSMESRIKRSHLIAYRAVALFQRHPNLVDYLPMFNDMTPIDWMKDSPRTIMRKFMRHLSATQPVLSILNKATISLAGYVPSGVIHKMNKWVIGGNIYRGFQQGLLELGPIPKKSSNGAYMSSPTVTQVSIKIQEAVNGSEKRNYSSSREKTLNR